MVVSGVPNLDPSHAEVIASSIREFASLRPLQSIAKGRSAEGVIHLQHDLGVLLLAVAPAVSHAACDGPIGTRPAKSGGTMQVSWNLNTRLVLPTIARAAERTRGESAMRSA
jgi:hypothetical protein